MEIANRFLEGRWKKLFAQAGESRSKSRLEDAANMAKQTMVTNRPELKEAEILAVKKILADPTWPKFRDWLIKKREDVKDPRWFPESEATQQFPTLHLRLEPFIRHPEMDFHSEYEATGEEKYKKFLESEQGQKFIDEKLKEVQMYGSFELQKSEEPYKSLIEEAIKAKGGEMIDPNSEQALIDEAISKARPGAELEGSTEEEKSETPTAASPTTPPAAAPAKAPRKRKPAPTATAVPAPATPEA